MNNDRSIAALINFSSLVEEADGISEKWDFIFVSSFCGINGHVPTRDVSDVHLKRMSNGLASGGQDLSQHLI